MSVSRVEQFTATLIAEYKAIKVANGYRNDVVDVVEFVADPSQITSTPLLEVILGSGIIEPIDDAWTAFHEWVPVWVIGHVSSKLDTSKSSGNLVLAMESLITDMKSVTVTIMKKYGIYAQATNKNPWVIDWHREPMKTARFIIKQSTRGQVMVSFMAKIWAEGTDFAS